MSWGLSAVRIWVVTREGIDVSFSCRARTRCFVRYSCPRLLKRDVEVAELLQSNLLLEVRGNDSCLLIHFDQARLRIGQVVFVLIRLLLEELRGALQMVNRRVLQKVEISQLLKHLLR